MEHSYVGNEFVETIVAALQQRSQRVVWAGDYADEEVDGMNLYGHADLVHNAPVEITRRATPTPYDYLVNTTRQEYVFMHNLPQVGWTEKDLQIHPLPLLTAEGNGRGGGDYRGVGMEYVGLWARHFIAITNAQPKSGWTEIRPNFTEE